MIHDINLLPDKVLYKKNRILNRVVKIAVIMILSITLVFAVSYKTLQRWELEKKVDQLIAGTNQDALKELKGAEDKLAETLKESAEAEERYEAIPGEPVRVTEVLNRVSSLMPPDILASSISFTPQEMILNLTASSRAEISLFLKRLHDETLFLNVTISSITGSGGSYQFSVSLGMKELQNNVE